MIDVKVDPRLKSQRFRQEREADWRRLERLIDKVEKGKIVELSEEDLLAAPVLYRSALSALSVARATSLDRGLIDYLETLCARSYFFVYGSRETVRGQLSAFFREGWPNAVRGVWRETLVSAGLLVIGAVIAAMLMSHEADWYYAFMPKAMAGGRDPAASTEMLRETLFSDQKDGLSFFAAFLFTHNAQIAILAFALGFALCLPTAGLVLYNGATLGAFFMLFASRGLGVEAGGWLAIHGVTELFAVVLAGAAGLRIGWAVIFPGERRRQDAIAEAGRQAATVMGGVVVMLFLAGLLEGYGRQLISLTPARYGVAALTAVLWGIYFYAPRGAPRHG